MTETARGRVMPLLKMSLRVSLGVGLMACLLWFNRENIAKLQTQEIRWGFFAAGFAVTLTAVLLTLFRWYLLVIAQGLSFRFRDSLRIGFIGYLFSQVIPGAVSGDLVKLVMLVREQERRTVAIATIILDRVVGLYGLILVTGMAAVISWNKLRPIPAVGDMLVLMLILVLAGTAGFAMMFLPIFRGGWTEKLIRVPLIGGTLRELASSIVVYQDKPLVIVLAIALSVSAHIGFVSGLYLVAAGLQGTLWAWQVHYVVAPLGLMVNAIPISPGGVGVGEAAMQALFAAVGEDGSKAFLMMLVFRAMSWGVAMIGAVYLVTGFSEARRAIAQARQSVVTADSA